MERRKYRKTKITKEIEMKNKIKIQEVVGADSNDSGVGGRE